MIRPGGLLLVAPTFVQLVSVLWVGLQKIEKLNLHVRNILAGSPTEHHWGCSKRWPSSIVNNWRLQYFLDENVQKKHSESSLG
jgi:hypothetical protein